MNEFITVEEARARILASLSPLGPERVFLAQASGRILAEPIAAPWDQPRFAHSARDGYAFRFADLDRANPRFVVVGRSAAGAPAAQSMQPGQAVRITTGAALPAGSDTVVMQENCTLDESSQTLTLSDPDRVRPAQWVRQVGEDMADGEVVLRPGMRLGPADIALLAGFGRALVTVARKPRVAIVSTGDELVDPGTPPGPAQIVNSNAYLLAALLTECGAEPLIMPIAADREDEIRQCFTQALAHSDLVLSSGGVSVGDFDRTGRVVDELAGGLDFWKIRMKPGKPLAFGVYRAGDLAAHARPVGLLGLPGNPNACFVCFHQFVRPALATLQGRALSDSTAPTPLPIPVRARLGTAIQTTPRRRVYLGGILQESTDTDATNPALPGALPIFYPAANQESGNLRLFCQANAFGRIEEGVATLEAGAEIIVERF